MATIDSLPPDQRAVLQLVLQRGRSYDEIANLLSIDRAAVRQRALDALDALTPAVASAPAERSLITDYLLGQLPAAVARQVHGLLSSSQADNRWARAVSLELADFGGDLAPVPDLAPLEPAAAAGSPQTTTDTASDLPSPAGEPKLHEPEFEQPPRDVAVEADLWLEEEEPPAADLGHRYERAARQRPAGSRKGGLVLLGGLLAVAVVVIVLAVAGVFSGGGGPAAPAAADHSGGNSTTKTGSSTNTAKYLAQINLTAPDGAKTPAGIVQVVEETLKGKLYKGVVVYAEGVPPNTKHDAYGMWLSNPGGASKFIGFVPKLVGKDEKLQTEGQLPSDATDYKQILVTLETSEKPTKPGTVVLSGAFTETPTK